MPVLRLFPLNIVVFPGQRTPLHIFEPRYRQLVRDVLDEDVEFGIALIKAGRDTGSGAIPYEVGCAVRIRHVEELPDGRFNITCEGTRRFRIVEQLGEDPYLRAEVEFPPIPADVDDEATRAMTGELREKFSAYLRVVLALQDSWQRRFRMPDDPAALGDFVAGQIDVAARIKQEVLQAPAVARRLELLRQILDVETGRLAEQVATRQRQKLAGLGALN